MKFSNTMYICNHGRNPRGFGRWAFMIRCRDEEVSKRNCPFEHYQQGAFVLIWASTTMTLTDAKKEVGDWLKSVGWKGLILVAD